MQLKLNYQPKLWRVNYASSRFQTVNLSNRRTEIWAHWNLGQKGA